MSESRVIFEREGSEEPALVIKVEDLLKLDHPKIQEILESISLSVDEFGLLLRLEFEPKEKPTNFPVTNHKGDKIEDVVDRIAQTSVGEVEVADVKLYPEVVSGKDDTSLHLKVGKNKGFEAIYVLSGEATLSFPNKVEPTGIDLYAASTKRSDVRLTPGTLAIIPAPCANGWSAVGENFRFRYICLPKWNPSFVRRAIDQG